MVTNFEDNTDVRGVVYDPYRNLTLQVPITFCRTVVTDGDKLDQNKWWLILKTLGTSFLLNQNSSWGHSYTRWLKDKIVTQFEKQTQQPAIQTDYSTPEGVAKQRAIKSISTTPLSAPIHLH